jgi:serine protease Do
VLGVVNGSEAFAQTHYEPVAAFLRAKDRLRDGQVVSARRADRPLRLARPRDVSPFAPTPELEDAIVRGATCLVRVLDGDVEVASGLIVDPSGWAVTKRTLVDGRTNLRCRLSQFPALTTMVRARVVGASPEHDLALLKLDAAGLPAPAWADRPPRVGALVAPRGDARWSDPLRVAVVGSDVRREDPRPGDVAQVPFYFEPDPDKRPVIQKSPVAVSGEVESQPEVFRPGDVITHLAGTPTPTMDELGKVLTGILYAAPAPGKPLDPNRAAPGNWAGEPLAVTVRRGDHEFRLRAVRVHSTIVGAVDWAQNPLSLRRDGFPAVFAHDGRIRPDQCGGPVLDLSGRVVGVNIARADETRTLAVPAEVVRQVVSQLREKAAK